MRGILFLATLLLAVAVIANAETVDGEGTLQQTCQPKWKACCPGQMAPAGICGKMDCPYKGKPCVGTWMMANCSHLCSPIDPSKELASVEKTLRYLPQENLKKMGYQKCASDGHACHCPKGSSVAFGTVESMAVSPFPSPLDRFRCSELVFTKPYGIKRVAAGAENLAHSKVTPFSEIHSKTAANGVDIKGTFSNRLHGGNPMNKCKDWISCCPGGSGGPNCGVRDCPHHGEACVGGWMMKHCASTCASVKKPVSPPACNPKWKACCPGEKGGANCGNVDCPHKDKPCVGTWVSKTCPRLCGLQNKPVKTKKINFGKLAKKLEKKIVNKHIPRLRVSEKHLFKNGKVPALTNRGNPIFDAKGFPIRLAPGKLHLGPKNEHGTRPLLDAKGNVQKNNNGVAIHLGPKVFAGQRAQAGPKYTRSIVSKNGKKNVYQMIDRDGVPLKNLSGVPIVVHKNTCKFARVLLGPDNKPMVSKSRKIMFVHHAHKEGGKPLMRKDGRIVTDADHCVLLAPEHVNQGRMVYGPKGLVEDDDEDDDDDEEDDDDDDDDECEQVVSVSPTTGHVVIDPKTGNPLLRNKVGGIVTEEDCDDGDDDDDDDDEESKHDFKVDPVTHKPLLSKHGKKIRIRDPVTGKRLNSHLKKDPVTGHVVNKRHGLGFSKGPVEGPDGQPTLMGPLKHQGMKAVLQAQKDAVKREKLKPKKKECKQLCKPYCMSQTSNVGKLPNCDSQCRRRCDFKYDGKKHHDMKKDPALKKVKKVTGGWEVVVKPGAKTNPAKFAKIAAKIAEKAAKHVSDLLKSGHAITEGEQEVSSEHELSVKHFTEVPKTPKAPISSSIKPKAKPATPAPIVAPTKPDPTKWQTLVGTYYSMSGIVFSNRNTQSCGMSCKRYKYFGVKKDGSCICSNYTSVHKAPKDCILGRLQCKYTLVYTHKVLPSDIVAIGNFKDRAVSSVMPYGPHKGGYTFDSCKVACSKHKYFALKDGGVCSCGDSYSGITKLGSCKGGPSGGHDCNAIYSKKSTTLVVVRRNFANRLPIQLISKKLPSAVKWYTPPRRKHCIGFTCSWITPLSYAYDRATHKLVYGKYNYATKKIEAVKASIWCSTYNRYTRRFERKHYAAHHCPSPPRPKPVVFNFAMLGHKMCRVYDRVRRAYVQRLCSRSSTSSSTKSAPGAIHMGQRCLRGMKFLGMNKTVHTCNTAAAADRHCKNMYWVQSGDRRRCYCATFSGTTMNKPGTPCSGGNGWQRNAQYNVYPVKRTSLFHFRSLVELEATPKTKSQTMCMCKDIAMILTEHKEALKEVKQQNLAKGFMKIKDFIAKENLKALKADRRDERKKVEMFKFQDVKLRMQAHYHDRKLRQIQERSNVLNSKMEQAYSVKQEMNKNLVAFRQTLADSKAELVKAQLGDKLARKAKEKAIQRTDIAKMHLKNRKLEMASVQQSTTSRHILDAAREALKAAQKLTQKWKLQRKATKLMAKSSKKSLKLHAEIVSNLKVKYAGVNVSRKIAREEFRKRQKRAEKGMRTLMNATRNAQHFSLAEQKKIEEGKKYTKQMKYLNTKIEEARKSIFTNNVKVIQVAVKKAQFKAGYNCCIENYCNQIMNRDANGGKYMNPFNSKYSFDYCKRGIPSSVKAETMMQCQNQAQINEILGIMAGKYRRRIYGNKMCRKELPDAYLEEIKEKARMEKARMNRMFQQIEKAKELEHAALVEAKLNLAQLREFKKEKSAVHQDLQRMKLQCMKVKKSMEFVLVQLAKEKLKYSELLNDSRRATEQAQSSELQASQRLAEAEQKRALIDMTRSNMNSTNKHEKTASILAEERKEQERAQKEVEKQAEFYRNRARLAKDKASTLAEEARIVSRSVQDIKVHENKLQVTLRACGKKRDKIKAQYEKAKKSVRHAWYDVKLNFYKHDHYFMSKAKLSTKATVRTLLTIKALKEQTKAIVQNLSEESAGCGGHHNWHCYKAEGAWVTARINPSICEVECLSFDSKNCKWHDNADACQNEIDNLGQKRVDPVTCRQHNALIHKPSKGRKNDQDGEWCDIVRDENDVKFREKSEDEAMNLCSGNTEWKCYAGYNSPVRFNPDQCELECFSTSGRKCVEGRNPAKCEKILSRIASAPIVSPLTCGYFMQTKLGGDSGYEPSSKNPWCKALLAEAQGDVRKAIEKEEEAVATVSEIVSNLYNSIKVATQALEIAENDKQDATSDMEEAQDEIDDFDMAIQLQEIPLRKLEGELLHEDEVLSHMSSQAVPRPIWNAQHLKVEDLKAEMAKVQAIVDDIKAQRDDSTKNNESARSQYTDAQKIKEAKLKLVDKQSKLLKAALKERNIKIRDLLKKVEANAAHAQKWFRNAKTRTGFLSILHQFSVQNPSYYL